MAEYDPTVIQEFADRQYRQARLMTIVMALIGAAAGAGAGFSIMRAVAPQMGPLVGGAALIGLLLGIIIAKEIAFSLKLRAQVALCQLKIEENTAQLLGSRARSLPQ